jgi:aldehyde dehydrogenase (NAD+)
MGDAGSFSFAYSRSSLPRQLFINNEYIDSKGSATITVYNPKDGSLVADNIPSAEEADVDLAVTAAEKAFPAWRKMKAVERREIMLKFASLLEQHTETLAELTRVTTGAPYGAWGKFEVGTGAELFRYYAGWIDKFAGESFPQDDGYMKVVQNEPLGVTAGITPWNGPTGNFGLKAAPALATGNCFILKPSEKSPFAGLALGALAVEAGFPPGVLQILSGDGKTGALLAAHMRIRKLSFTGSIATGKKVQEVAAKSNLKRVTLELGGKSPAVVFNDCNLDNAVKWCADMITANTGQVCIAASRVYVQEGIYDQFISRYKSAVLAKRAKIGDPEHEGTEIGPLADKVQFDRVMGFIERAEKGNSGNLMIGGKRIGEQGFFVEPTIFTDIDIESEIHNNEVFGPVSVVRKFKTEDEVIQLSNNTNTGLMAGVFTQDINRALRIAREFESGMVGINCVSLFFLTSPFGGSKESGLGRECGRDALKAFTETKTVMINLTY